MKALIFDRITRSCLGWVEGQWDGDAIAHEVAEIPDDLNDLSLSDDGTLVRDPVATLNRAQDARIAGIKREAAALISASNWRVERAREREITGVGTLAETAAVLAEREAIRQSSSAAETAVLALTDPASVRAFSWSVDVPIASPRLLTHKQFADRFTETELQAILTAADANPALRAWWEKFRLAQDINLDDPACVAGLQALEIAGLIAAGRAEEIAA